MDPLVFLLSRYPFYLYSFPRQFFTFPLYATKIVKLSKYLLQINYHFTEIKQRITMTKFIRTLMK